MANNFTDKITEAANFNQSNTSDHLFVGVVIEADEPSNLCNVNLVTQYGDIITKYHVTVSSENNTGVIGWFPNVGDKVYIRFHNNNKYEIVSLYSDDYITKHKHNIDIKYNLLSNFYNYTIGGNIF